MAIKNNSDTDTSRIGIRIRELRLQRGMSGNELAQASNISKATLSILESGGGNPTIETLAALAKALRLPLGDLISNIDSKASPIVQKSSSPPKDIKQELLYRVGSGSFLEIWRLRICSGNRVDSPAHIRGTMEYILSLKGTLLIEANSSQVKLEEGDFMTFSADTTHSYIAHNSDVDATVIMSYPLTPPSLDFL